MEQEKTIFERIIRGEIPSVKVYEDEVCIAIMDKFPRVIGQCLVIPKKPVAYAFDLDDATYSHILLVAKKLVSVLDAVIKPLRTCLVIEGFEVPHTHIKLYPIINPPLVPSSGPEASIEELEQIASQIRQHLEAH